MKARTEQFEKAMENMVGELHTLIGHNQIDFDFDYGNYSAAVIDVHLAMLVGCIDIDRAAYAAIEAKLTAVTSTLPGCKITAQFDDERGHAHWAQGEEPLEIYFVITVKRLRSINFCEVAAGILSMRRELGQVAGVTQM